MQRSLQELLLERVAAGRTVFFSSHLISEVERICNRVAIVRGGKLVALETVETLVRFQRRRVDALVARKPTRLTSLTGVFGVKVSPEGKSGYRISCEAESAAVPKLISRLQTSGLRDLLIEAASLEEAFMSYYGDVRHSSGAVQVFPEVAEVKMTPSKPATKRPAKKAASKKSATKKRSSR
jgi:ABC-2 type transport system ATP-binding protein